MVSLDGIGGQRSDMHQPLLLQVLILHAAAYSMYSYVAERIVANFRACRCRTQLMVVLSWACVMHVWLLLHCPGQPWLLERITAGHRSAHRPCVCRIPSKSFCLGFSRILQTEGQSWLHASCAVVVDCQWQLQPWTEPQPIVDTATDALMPCV